MYFDDNDVDARKTKQLQLGSPLDSRNSTTSQDSFEFDEDMFADACDDLEDAKEENEDL